MAAAGVVDFTTFNPDVEIIVRAGNVQVHDARQVLQDNYRVEDRRYQNLAGQNMRGLSVLFQVGASYQQLVQHNSLPHRMLSYATARIIQDAILRVGYDIILYRTPSPKLPDHHSLVISSKGQELVLLPDAEIKSRKCCTLAKMAGRLSNYAKRGKGCWTGGAFQRWYAAISKYLRPVAHCS